MDPNHVVGNSSIRSRSLTQMELLRVLDLLYVRAEGQRQAAENASDSKDLTERDLAIQLTSHWDGRVTAINHIRKLLVGEWADQSGLAEAVEDAVFSFENFCEIA